MPSKRAIGLRRDAAIESLETALPGLSLPRRFNFRQKGMEDVIVLEAIVAYFDSEIEDDGDPETVDYSSWTMDDLTVEAEARGIFDMIEGTGSNGNVLKVDIVAALEADDGDA